MMIAALLAAALAVAPCTGTTCTTLLSSSGTTTQTMPVIKAEPGTLVVMRMPPCAKSGMIASDDCTKWEVMQPMMFQHADGTQEPIDRAAAIRLPAGASSVVYRHGTPYLNTGDGRGVMMSAGRCSYSTEYRGRFYADQDFTRGAGIGVPKPGSKPC